MAGGDAPPPVVSLSSSPLAPVLGCLAPCRLGDSALLWGVGARRWGRRGEAVYRCVGAYVHQQHSSSQAPNAPSPHLMALLACLMAPGRGGERRRAVVQPLLPVVAAGGRRPLERGPSLHSHPGVLPLRLPQPDWPATALGSARHRSPQLLPVALQAPRGFWSLQTDPMRGKAPDAGRADWGGGAQETRCRAGAPLDRRSQIYTRQRSCGSRLTGASSSVEPHCRMGGCPPSCGSKSPPTVPIAYCRLSTPSSIATGPCAALFRPPATGSSAPSRLAPSSTHRR